MSSEERRRGTFRSAWRHRRWRYLLVSFGVSATGDFLYAVALTVYLLERTGSVTWVAVAAVGRLVPYAVLGPLGGVIADRYDRRLVMIVFDLVRAGCMAAMALVAAVDGPAWVVVVMAVGSAAASTPYRPAVAAATPHVVGEDDLAAANAVEGVVGQLSLFVGPALGALLLAVTSPATSFLVNALTFVVSAALVARIGAAGGGAAKAGTGAELRRPGPLAQLADGWRMARTTPGVMALIVLSSAVMFAFGMELVLQVLVSKQRLGLGDEGIGWLLAAVGAGGLAAAPFASRLAAGARAGTALAVSGVFLGGPLIFLSLVREPAVAFALMFVEGIGNVTFEVLAITLLQRLVAGEAVGRVFGLQDSVTAVTQVLGTVMAPVLVAVAGLQWALVVAGGSLLAVAIACVPAFARGDAAQVVRRQRLAPVVEELATLSLFDGAAVASLERLAGETREKVVSAGTAVVVEGDEPDDLYVIRAGRFEVSAAGELAQATVVNEMGPGEWFGEIGLVTGTARTATVTATTDGVLWQIPGPAFADALAAEVVLADPLRRGISNRLGRTHPSRVTG